MPCQVIPPPIMAHLPFPRGRLLRPPICKASHPWETIQVNITPEITDAIIAKKNCQNMIQNQDVSVYLLLDPEKVSILPSWEAWFDHQRKQLSMQISLSASTSLSTPSFTSSSTSTPHPPPRPPPPLPLHPPPHPLPLHIHLLIYLLIHLLIPSWEMRTQAWLDHQRKQLSMQICNRLPPPALPWHKKEKQPM